MISANPTFMIVNCVSMPEIGLPENFRNFSRVSPFGDALVFVEVSALQSNGIHLPRNANAHNVMDPSHPRFHEVVPVWVRIVEKCEDGSFLGFQTDLRSRPFGVKVSPNQMLKFYSRKTLVAA